MRNNAERKKTFSECLKSFFVKFGKLLKSFFISIWKDKTKIMMAVAVVCIFFGALFAFFINTDWGRVQVYSFKLNTEDSANGGKTHVVADVYRPRTATADSQAPCVIVCPGYQRTKETQSAYNIELSRRGFVVVCLDPYSQGESSSTDLSASAAGYGLFSVIEYVVNSEDFDFVDKDRVGVAGHSAGGNACIYAMMKYGTKNNSLISASYISGYVRNTVLTSSSGFENLKGLKCNVGLAYARYDEGAYQNAGTSTIVDDKEATSLDYSDMRYAVPAINLVNSGIYVHEGNDRSFVNEVEIDAYYGSPDDGSFRVIHNEKTIHGLQPYDNLSISHMVNFFDYVFFDNAVYESGLNPTAQVWAVKETFQGIYLVGMFLFMLSFATLLLRTKFFATATHEVQPMGQNDSRLDKVFFWLIFAVCAVFALFSYDWMSNLASKWFTTGVSKGLTWLFPQRMTNAVMLWSIVNGILGLTTFLLMHFLRHRKRGATLNNLKDKPSNIFKMLLLAFCTFAAFYFIVDITYLALHVDPRFFFVSARPILFSTNSRILVMALMYMPMFFLFYFTNSVRVNCSMRKARWGKAGSIVIACLANTLGLIGIVFLQYVVFAATGTVWITENWLYVNLLWGVIPMMLLLPIFNRYFYEKTGKVWLGTFLNLFVFIMMTLTNTVTYLPV